MTRTSENGASGERGTVADVVLEIASSVQRSELRLGDQLPAERELAQQLGISRTTVRKGLGRLRELGLVESRSGRGRLSGTFVVSELVPPELLGTPQPVSFDEISDVLIARREVEVNVALLASEVAGDEDIRRMREVLYEQIAAREDVLRVRQLDPSFHLAIARATHNDVVVALMQMLLRRLEVSRYPPAPPGEAHSTVEMHEATIDAIISRDEARVRRTMREHLEVLEHIWEATTGRQMPPWREVARA
ncbi:MAG: FadR/GntR family transcriptional regulator [Solirubrobacteraceae bacterium]